MIDEAWLGTWFEPRHVDAAGVARLRGEFERHPARLVVLSNALRDPVAARLEAFLEHDVRWERRRQLERDRGSGRETGPQAWDEAPEEERFFRYDVGEMPKGPLNPRIAEALRFTLALRDPRMLAYFGAITGVRPVPGTVTFHAMSSGDFLRPHDDDSRGRRLAFIAYLTSGWRPEYGGSLVVRDREGRRTEIEPTAASLVVFDVTAHEAHWVEPVRPEAGPLRRLSIGGWFGEAPP